LLTPFLTGQRQTSFQRPNLEIDARVRRRSDEVGAGFSMDLGSKFTLGGEAHRTTSDYDDAIVDGANVAALSNRTESVRGSLDIALTPLTTLTTSAGLSQQRNDEAAFRDIDTIDVRTGFRFAPVALISGGAQVGLTRQVSKSGELPEFTGVTAAVDVAYVWRESTRIGVGVTRGSEPSVDPDQPYYVSTGGSLSVSQAIGLRWDLGVRASRTSLDYRSRLTSTSGQGPRTDRVDTYGADLGLHTTADFRVGLETTYTRRISPVDGRSYDGYRVGGNVTYGN
jgi:hypothetical protein